MGEPILFIFGSSGVGKTTLGKLLNMELNFLHVNFDPEVQKGRSAEDGYAKEGLKDEWCKFWDESQPFATKIRQKIRSSGSHGACVTLRSYYLLGHVSCIKKLKPQNIFYVVLYASADECFKGFSERDDGIAAEHKNNKPGWTKTNCHWHDLSGLSDFQENVIHTFNGSDRRPNQDIIEDVRRAIGMTP